MALRTSILGTYCEALSIDTSFGHDWVGFPAASCMWSTWPPILLGCLRGGCLICYEVRYSFWKLCQCRHVQWDTLHPCCKSGMIFQAWIRAAVCMTIMCSFNECGMGLLFPFDGLRKFGEVNALIGQNLLLLHVASLIWLMMAIDIKGVWGVDSPSASPPSSFLSRLLICSLAGSICSWRNHDDDNSFHLHLFKQRSGSLAAEVVHQNHSFLWLCPDLFPDFLDVQKGDFLKILISSLALWLGVWKMSNTSGDHHVTTILHK